MSVRVATPHNPRVSPLKCDPKPYSRDVCHCIRRVNVASYSCKEVDMKGGRASSELAATFFK